MNSFKVTGLIVMAFFAVEVGFAQSYEIFIEGILRERREQNRPGQSLIISPDAETRFDANNQMRSDPSIALAGDQNASTFSLPLFRGQDAHSTHIFVDDLELLDPFSGLPMIDEIDLRAFGSMTIHKGFAPWNLSVLDPGGVIQFSTRRSAKLEGGGAYGNVSGTSGWGQWSQSDERLDSRVYLRRSVSRGDYSFYDDNETVLNPSDDKISRRGNNDRQSIQSLGQVRWQDDKFRLKGLFWGQMSQAGIPIGMSGADGGARVRSKTMAMTSSARFELSNAIVWGIDGGHFSAQRKFNDPSGDIGFAAARSLQTSSSNIRLFTEGGIDRWRWTFAIDDAEAATNMTSTYEHDVYAPKSSRKRVFVGNRLRPFVTDTIELKGAVEQSTAKTRDINRSKNISFHEKPAGGGSIAWSRSEDHHWVYAQLGHTARNPSLMERVGNGAERDGAMSLNPQITNAAEFGGRYHVSMAPGLGFSVGGSFWGRDNEQVIRIEKISATRWRAQNQGRQSYRGVEGRFESGSERMGVEVACSFLRATQIESGRLVPRVPIWQAVGGPRWVLHEDITLRGQSRFVGRMYDDTGNTREIGWILTHDVSVDWVPTVGRWRIGAMIRNLTNVMALPVRDVSTGQSDGKMAYSGFNGEPMTGRSWTISMSAHL